MSPSDIFTTLPLYIQREMIRLVFDHSNGRTDPSFEWQSEKWLKAILESFYDRPAYIASSCACVGVTNESFCHHIENPISSLWIIWLLFYHVNGKADHSFEWQSEKRQNAISYSESCDKPVPVYIALVVRACVRGCFRWDESFMYHRKMSV